MADLPGRNELFAVARRALRIRGDAGGLRINPAMVDVAGSDLNLLFGTLSMQGEELSAAWARCVLEFLVETAEDDALDRIAYDRFGLRRIPATAATVALTLSRATSGGGPGVVPFGTRVTTPGGLVFALQTDVSFGSGQLSASAVGVAQEVGPSHNVSLGDITKFIDQPFDPTIQVSNPEPGAGGSERESNARFRGRIRGFYLTVRRGTIAAVRYGALQVPGVAVASAFDIVNPGDGLPAGAGEVVVGDANGVSSPSILQAVRDEELNWRPIGIPLFVFGGNVTFVPVTYKLAFDDSVDTVRAASEVRATAVAASQFLGPGEAVTRALLLAAAGAVPGVRVLEDALPEPAGDVFPTSAEELLRIRASDVAFV